MKALAFRRMETLATGQEKIFANFPSDKGPIPRIHKELWKLNIKKFQQQSNQKMSQRHGDTYCQEDMPAPGQSSMSSATGKRKWNHSEVCHTSRTANITTCSEGVGTGTWRESAARSRQTFCRELGSFFSKMTCPQKWKFPSSQQPRHECSEHLYV